MINLLIISNEAKDIYSLLGAGDVAADTRDSRQKAGAGADRTAGEDYDMAFLDLDMADWQQRLADLRQRMPVVAFSAPDLRKAVEAMKLGASDYIGKPLTNESVGEILGKHRKTILTQRFGFDEITGTSRPMQEIFGLIRRAAASESNVLITGESGTGKELVARAIHRWSPRSGKSFMTINCSAIPDTLLESELFGFEKGAFTGANFPKKGLLEVADGGTVFFDEIGDVSPLFQTKILRVLQEGEIMRIGGSRQIGVDIRIIAATNRDLRACCQKNIFREDLYYRLNVINIHLPPLRERMEDVPFLVKKLIEKHAPKRKDILIRGITRDAMDVLMSYNYPGNVRELENIVERAISFATTPELLCSDLPASLLQSPVKPRSPLPKLHDAVAAREREVIEAALSEAGGNISRAALALGVYRQHLQRKIKSLRIAT